MKNKLIFSILLVLTTISLCSCIVLPMRHKYDDFSADDIISIEVYDLRGNTDDSSGFYKNIQSVYTLKASDHDDFLDKLSEINFRDGIIIFPPAAQDPSFNYGNWVVRINFSNGNFQFISNTGFSEIYNSKGKCIDTDHYGCDNEEWLDLLEDFVPDEIINSPIPDVSVSK